MNCHYDLPAMIHCKEGRPAEEQVHHLLPQIALSILENNSCPSDENASEMEASTFAELSAQISSLSGLSSYDLDLNSLPENHVPHVLYQNVTTETTSQENHNYRNYLNYEPASQEEISSLDKQEVDLPEGLLPFRSIENDMNNERGSSFELKGEHQMIGRDLHRSLLPQESLIGTESDRYSVYEDIDNEIVYTRSFEHPANKNMEGLPTGEGMQNSLFELSSVDKGHGCYSPGNVDEELASIRSFEAMEINQKDQIAKGAMGSFQEIFSIDKTDVALTTGKSAGQFSMKHLIQQAGRGSQRSERRGDCSRLSKEVQHSLPELCSVDALRMTKSEKQPSCFQEEDRKQDGDIVKEEEPTSIPDISSIDKGDAVVTDAISAVENATGLFSMKNLIQQASLGSQRSERKGGVMNVAKSEDQHISFQERDRKRDGDIAREETHTSISASSSIDNGVAATDANNFDGVVAMRSIMEQLTGSFPDVSSIDKRFPAVDSGSSERFMSMRNLVEQTTTGSASIDVSSIDKRLSAVDSGSSKGVISMRSLVEQATIESVSIESASIESTDSYNSVQGSEEMATFWQEKSTNQEDIMSMASTKDETDQKSCHNIVKIEECEVAANDGDIDPVITPNQSLEDLAEELENELLSLIESMGLCMQEDEEIETSDAKDCKEKNVDLEAVCSVKLGGLPKEEEEIQISTTETSDASGSKPKSDLAEVCCVKEEGSRMKEEEEIQLSITETSHASDCKENNDSAEECIVKEEGLRVEEEETQLPKTDTSDASDCKEKNRPTEICSIKEQGLLMKEEEEIRVRRTETSKDNCEPAEVCKSNEEEGLRIEQETDVKMSNTEITAGVGDGTNSLAELRRLKEKLRKQSLRNENLKRDKIHLRNLNGTLEQKVFQQQKELDFMCQRIRLLVKEREPSKSLFRKSIKMESKSADIGENSQASESVDQKLRPIRSAETSTTRNSWREKLLGRKQPYAQLEGEDAESSDTKRLLDTDEVQVATEATGFETILLAEF